MKPTSDALTQVKETTAISSAKKGNKLTAIYTFDVFCSLDGNGSVSRGWGGDWGKQGPELLEYRLAL